MDFSQIFDEYYTLYRGEGDSPAQSDEEWRIAIRLGNQAIRRWDRIDGVLWRELFKNAQDANTGERTIEADKTAYDAPTDFRKPGGYIFLVDPDNAGDRRRVKLIQPEQAQRKPNLGSYGYFTGNPNSGYKLNLNLNNLADVVGFNIDYVYYKLPAYFPANEDGTTKPDMNDANFIVQYMLANRFRASRNWAAYQTATRDADEALQNMLVDNTAGTDTANFLLEDSNPIGS